MQKVESQTPLLPSTPLVKKVAPELKSLPLKEKHLLYRAAELGLYWAIVQRTMTKHVVVVGYWSCTKVATKHDLILKYSNEGWVVYEEYRPGYEGEK